MSIIDFYDVNKNYISFLKKYESKIPDISYSNHDKFVCGIVLNISDINYFAPISSFNIQQKTNILILNENNRPISSIRFSFMFPAPKDVLIKKDFSKEEEKYKYLLMHEYNYCNKHKDQIYKKALYVYKRVISGHDKMMVKNCCNFKLLEQKCAEYEIKSSLVQTAAAEHIKPQDNGKSSIKTKLLDIKMRNLEKPIDGKKNNIER